ncbi:MAG: alpha/beta fold hydrolase [Peptococcaceae bacterium]|jgi:dienelactone hydrolase|nr:alpha/beta fold hydrolase [Peptococcaceae bacterium]
MNRQRFFRRLKTSVLAGLLVLGLMALGVSGCGKSAPTPEETNKRLQELLPIAEDLLNDLEAGKYAEIVDQYFDATMQKALGAETLAQSWQTISSFGTLQNIERQQATLDRQQKYDVLTLPLLYSAGLMHLICTFDHENNIAGLFLRPATNTGAAAEQPSLPDALEEREMRLEVQPGYPLPGTLTLPVRREGTLPAVILVHGSGPQDRNETIYANQPFRDLAWGLAQQGIAVLRYEKITKEHGAALVAAPEYANFTVREETILDAVGLTAWLKNQPEIDATQVYILGHSQGGMLAPAIENAGADAAGMVILAGSPRHLWEIIYDQNLDALAQMESQGKDTAAQRAQLEEEIAKARQLPTMREEEARATTIFGISGYYLWQWESIDAAALLKQSGKPALILQGSRDFQVYATKDYPLWQKQLQGTPDITYHLYPGLSHIFGAYAGDGAGTIGEYQHPQPIAAEVIEDIAQWIQK